MEKRYENFWETEYPFRKFLQSIFPTYKTKYSLTGDGIFNLVIIDNKMYEIKYTKAIAMGSNDTHKIDNDKKYIIDNIINNLKTNNIAIFGGKYITFPIGQWVAKVEIIKKKAEPK